MGCIPSSPQQAAVQESTKPMPVAPKAVELPVREQPGLKPAYAPLPNAADDVPVTDPSAQAAKPVEVVETTVLLQDQKDGQSGSIPCDDNDLLLDFELFQLLPDVIAALEIHSIDHATLLERFNAADGNMDGMLNDREREALVASLKDSVQGTTAKQAQSTPVKETVTAETPAQVNAPTGLPTPPAQDASQSTQPAADGAQRASGPRGRDGRAKPKVIKFIAPQLIEPNSVQPIPTSGSTGAMEQPAEAPRRPVSSGSKSGAEGEESPDRESPKQKKGFMVTKRESFNKIEIISAPESRFFTLDNGCLSYMDSTSKKPPFSMSHRHIDLAKVSVTVNKNVIELAPRARNSLSLGQSGSEKDDGGSDVVVLELKSEAECADWLRAINEHLAFAAGTDGDGAAAPQE